MDLRTYYEWRRCVDQINKDLNNAADICLSRGGSVEQSNKLFEQMKRHAINSAVCTLSHADQAVIVPKLEEYFDFKLKAKPEPRPDVRIADAKALLRVSLVALAAVLMHVSYWYAPNGNAERAFSDRVGDVFIFIAAVSFVAHSYLRLGRLKRNPK